MPELNYNVKLEEVTRILAVWSKRQITPLGKIVVIKSIVLSKFIHLFMVLPNPSPEWLKKLEKLFFHFLWKRTDKVARVQLVQDYAEGGLRMVHLDSFIKSMKLSWIRRLLISESHAQWAQLYDHLLGCPALLFKFGDAYTKRIMKQIRNPFWMEVFEGLLKLRGIFNHDEAEILSHPLWYNSRIRVGRQALCMEQWAARGLLEIGDLMNSSGRIMTYAEFKKKYSFSPMATHFYGLKCAILNGYPELRGRTFARIRPSCPKYIYCLLNSERGGRKAYGYLVKSIRKEQKYQEKWDWELGLENSVDLWKQINCEIRSLTGTPLRWLQYKIIHRILGTNAFLYKVGLLDSPLCSFCNRRPESISHLLWDCPVTAKVVDEVRQWLGKIYGKTVHITGQEFILGKYRAEIPAFNLIMVVLKRYIYGQKLKLYKPAFAGFLRDLRMHYQLEYYISKNNGSEELFVEKWSPLHELLQVE